MKPKLFILIILSVFNCFILNAQLKLIPYPQNLEPSEEFFVINTKTNIISNNLDTFYVNELTNCIKQEFGISPKASKKANKNSIELTLLNDSNKLIKFLTKQNLDKNFNPEEEGYIVEITKKGIQIIAMTNTGIFYGIQTLNQIISANSTKNSIPCLIIYDKPDIPIRGWQDDISRGPIPKMSMLKEEIRKMASYKLNYFTLYIEHVFKLEKHPGIAPEDGITKAQIDELTIYAKKYHVNLIGSYQSFGHMEETLCHPKYKHLAENDHIISPVLDESYEFLNDVYQEIVTCFGGEYFNINCDETFGLGEGKSKELVDSIGIDGVYLSHITKLNNMLRPFDKKILMWGDIVCNHPQIIKKLPVDITVIAWGYHPAESFDYAITPISTTGLNFWIAPGINCWRNIYPDLTDAEINIYNFIRDGYKFKTSGVLNTSWDDDGFNFFQNNWHGLIWGAENCWNAPPSFPTFEESDTEREKIYNQFNNSFDAIFYELTNDSLINDIIAFSKLKSFGVKDIFNNNQLFDDIFPIHKDLISNDKRLKNIAILSKVDSIKASVISKKSLIKQNQITINYLELAFQQVQFNALKNILRIDLFKYLNNESSKPVSELKKDIEYLVILAKDIKSAYAILWQYENRDYWLSVNMKKYDDLINYLENLEGHCIITPSEKLTEKGREITVRSLFNNLPVYYSINNDTVSTKSTQYKQPFFINQDANIKAQCISENKSYPMTEINVINHLAIGKLHKINCNYSTYHPSYDGGGKQALLDGFQGDPNNLRSGKWQGFSGQNIDIEIDLEEIKEIQYFSMGFYQNTFSWVIFPKKIEIFYKNKIEDDYKLLETLINLIPPEENGNLKQNFEAKFNNTKVRYIKIVAHYYGKLPEWHHAGSNYESMLFSDEIIIK